jgi:hypothetical protein
MIAHLGHSTGRDDRSHLVIELMDYWVFDNAGFCSNGFLENPFFREGRCTGAQNQCAINLSNQ